MMHEGRDAYSLAKRRTLDSLPLGGIEIHHHRDPRAGLTSGEGGHAHCEPT